MNMKNYAETVRRMRIAQKMFFKTRMKNFLIEAKVLEKKVDELTQEILQIDNGVRFIRAVKKLRDKQKEYFTCKNFQQKRSILASCMELERSVDNMNLKVLEGRL